MLEQESPNIAPTPTLSQPGLLVMDVDSTLIDEEVIDELGAAAGIGEQIASITARAMNDELDFREALQARVALLKDLPTSVFDDVYRRVHFTHGALDLIDALHAHDWKVGVVSGGFHEVVDCLAADAHLDFWIAVGDGANDLPMIHAAGLGVAFCAKPAVQADAPHRVNERDLTRILDFLR